MKYLATYLMRNPMYPTIRHMARVTERRVSSKEEARALVTNGTFLELLSVEEV